MFKDVRFFVSVAAILSKARLLKPGLFFFVVVVANFDAAQLIAKSGLLYAADILKRPRIAVTAVPVFLLILEVLVLN